MILVVESLIAHFTAGDGECCGSFVMKCQYSVVRCSMRRRLILMVNFDDCGRRHASLWFPAGEDLVVIRFWSSVFLVCLKNSLFLATLFFFFFSFFLNACAGTG